MRALGRLGLTLETQDASVLSPTQSGLTEATRDQSGSDITMMQTGSEANARP